MSFFSNMSSTDSTLFRLLTGELLQIGADVPEKQWCSVIANELGVSPYQVVIAENNIFVRSTPTVTLKHGVHILSFSPILSATLIEHAMDQSLHAKNAFSSVWQLPHRLVVQKITSMTQIPDTILDDLLVNPHDDILDLIIANPPSYLRVNYLGRLSLNSNPRAIAHVISAFQKNHPGQDTIVEHSYMYLTYNWLRIFNNTTDRDTLEWIFRLFERSHLLNQLLYNDEIGDLFAPYILSGDFNVNSAIASTTHPAIIEYILEKVEVEKKIDGPFYMLTFNPHEMVVDYLILHPELISTNRHTFNKNPSDKAVDWLLAHPELIDWDAFAANTNPRARKACRHRDNVSWDASFETMCDAIVEERAPMLPLEKWWQLLMCFGEKFVDTEFLLN
jgi:hypothetical protein